MGESTKVRKPAVLQLAVWTAVWLLSLALANFGPALIWDRNPVVGSIAIGVNVAVGIGWIIAHARYLRGLDDLQRKITLDAIALAIGVGLVGGFAYSAAESAGLLVIESGIAFVSVLMGIAYAVSMVVVSLRYR